MVDRPYKIQGDEIATPNVPTPVAPTVPAIPATPIKETPNNE